jgi:hypothetical protein
MMQLELSESEASLLKEIVEKHLADLGAEIHRTDSLEFKEMLKAREQAATQLAAKLASALGQIARKA